MTETEYETAKAQLAALEAAGDGGAERDAEKAELRTKIARHDRPPRWGGTVADVSYAALLERQQPVTLPAQLTAAQARLAALGASEAAGGQEEADDVVDARRQIRNLEGQLAHEARVRRVRAEGDAERAAVRAQLSEGLAGDEDVAKEIEAHVTAAVAAIGRLRARGAERQKQAWAYGVQGKHAEAFSYAGYIQKFLKWRFGAALNVARMDGAVMRPLSVAIPELTRLLGGAE